MTRKRPRVGVDVDGVLADLLTPMFEHLNGLFGTSYSPDHMKSWALEELITPAEAETFWRSFGREVRVHEVLKPYPGAVEGLQRLAEAADVYVVTAYMRGAVTWVHDRDEWIHEHFGVPRARMVHTAAKYVFAGAALVDDKPANVEDWQAEHPHGAGILWAQPYNQTHRARHRTRSWDEVIALVTGG